MSRNRVIGANNDLPWHLPSDLKHFRSITMGKPMLMGRRTHESLGRPLPGRTNIVLTSRPDYSSTGCEVVHSIDAAKVLAAGTPELMVIGGAMLYKSMLDQAHRIYLTMVHAEFSGDTYFPELNLEDWAEESRQHHLADERNAYDHTFIVLGRRVATKDPAARQ